MRHSLAPLLFSLVGCIPVPDLDLSPDCEHIASYRDVDGDGLGDPTVVYFGCEVPEGYVTQAEALDTGATHTGDSGGTEDSGGSGSESGDGDSASSTGDTTDSA